MTWLIVHLWLLLVIAFLSGAWVTWVVANLLLPHVDDLGLRPDERKN